METVPGIDAIKQAAALLLECYREPMTRACRCSLLILARKRGSASLNEAGKAVRVPGALKPQVFADALGPLLDQGLIRPIAPTQQARAVGCGPNDTRYEIADHDRSLAWLVSGFRPTTPRPPCLTPGPAPEG